MAQSTSSSSPTASHDTLCSTHRSSSTGSSTSSSGSIASNSGGGDELLVQLLRGDDDGGLMDREAHRQTARVLMRAANEFASCVCGAVCAAPSLSILESSLDVGAMAQQVRVSRVVYTALLRIREQLLRRNDTPLPVSQLIDAALLHELFPSRAFVNKAPAAQPVGPDRDTNAAAVRLDGLFRRRPSPSSALPNRATQVDNGVMSAAAAAVKVDAVAPVFGRAMPVTVIAAVGGSEGAAPRSLMCRASLVCGQRVLALFPRPELVVRYEDVTALHIGLGAGFFELLHSVEDPAGAALLGSLDRCVSLAVARRRARHGTARSAPSPESTLGEFIASQRRCGVKDGADDAQRLAASPSWAVALCFDVRGDLDALVAAYRRLRPRLRLEPPPLSLAQPAILDAVPGPDTRPDGTVRVRDSGERAALRPDEALFCRRIHLPQPHYLRLRLAVRDAVGPRRLLSCSELAAAAPGCDKGRLLAAIAFFEDKGWVRPHRLYRPRR